MFIPFLDTYIVIPPLYVEFSIEVCSTKVSNEGLDEWKGVVVANGYLLMAQ
jgi:hypothetical protein